jgi:hypothetical protein
LQSVNWAWGLSLIALTIAIHAMGVVMMAIVGSGIRVRLENRNLGLREVILIVTGGVGAVGLLLAVLHGIEATIWATAYVWLGALDSLNDAVLYSLDSMTTRGASGLCCNRIGGRWMRWRRRTVCYCSGSARPKLCPSSHICHLLT